MTVTDLLAKAKYPERIYVGILSQIDRRTESKYLASFGRRIRQEVLDYRDSKGVCWARSRILTKLREQEDYVLQIDSHSRFKPNWDETLLNMYHKLGRQNAVITYYPPNYTPNQPIDYRDNSYFYFLIKEFNEPGIPRFSSGVLPSNHKPINECGTIGLAGGCIFGHKSVFDTVPYDPYLYFFGEEPSYAVRLYTHGIDCFSPTDTFMYHFYNIMAITKLKDRTLHWEDHQIKTNQLNKIAHDRLRYLFNLGGSIEASSLIDIQKYGLGKQRSLRQWQDHIGIDLATKYISESTKTRIYY